jgi:hypothetical protein
MSIFNILSAALIALILVAGMILFTGVRTANAGFFGTPTGGWGVESAPEPGPRGGRFGQDGR